MLSHLFDNRTLPEEAGLIQISINPVFININPGQVNKMNAGKFTLYKGTNGQFYFNLKAVNNHIIMQSEGYTTKWGALKGIASVKRHAPTAELADLTAGVG